MVTAGPFGVLFSIFWVFWADDDAEETNTVLFFVSFSPEKETKEPWHPHIYMFSCANNKRTSRVVLSGGTIS